MLLYKKVKDLESGLNRFRVSKSTIGFAPTMGALHQGHLSLISQSREKDDVTVCSVFVNPTQFNEASDLEKYPRTATRDIDLLTSVGTDVLFMPSVAEVYPAGLDTRLDLDFGALASVMEGRHRPGHFEGMAQVVNRLLEIVRPDRLYMGQKDFQQFTIVSSMIRQLGKEIELVVCPIIREADGLAMSSRNARLTVADRQQAPQIYQSLKTARESMNTHPPARIRETALQKLSAFPSFRPEYFEIVDGYTLQSITDFDAHSYVVACTAVWVGEVRLIDNLILKEARPGHNQ